MLAKDLSTTQADLVRAIHSNWISALIVWFFFFPLLTKSFFHPEASTWFPLLQLELLSPLPWRTSPRSPPGSIAYGGLWVWWTCAHPAAAVVLAGYAWAVQKVQIYRKTIRLRHGTCVGVGAPHYSPDGEQWHCFGKHSSRPAAIGLCYPRRAVSWQQMAVCSASHSVQAGCLRVKVCCFCTGASLLSYRV